MLYPEGACPVFLFLPIVWSILYIYAPRVAQRDFSGIAGHFAGAFAACTGHMADSAAQKGCFHMAEVAGNRRFLWHLHELDTLQRRQRERLQVHVHLHGSHLYAAIWNGLRHRDFDHRLRHADWNESGVRNGGCKQPDLPERSRSVHHVRNPRVYSGAVRAPGDGAHQQADLPGQLRRPDAVV